MMGEIFLMATAADSRSCLITGSHLHKLLYAERLVSQPNGSCCPWTECVCVLTRVTFLFSRYSVVSVSSFSVKLMFCVVIEKWSVFISLGRTCSHDARVPYNSIYVCVLDDLKSMTVPLYQKGAKLLQRLFFPQGWEEFRIYLTLSLARQFISQGPKPAFLLPHVL